MIFTIILPKNFTNVFAAEDFIIVDDVETNESSDYYFTYSSLVDKSGLRGWAADTKQSIIGNI